jgi:hypothetical protein
MKQKNDPKGKSRQKNTKPAGTGTGPYEKTSGKSPSDPARNEETPAGKTVPGSGKWEYPEESAQIKNRPVGNRNAGGYKQDELVTGSSAPDDEDDDYNEDVRDNEYLDDDDEEF